MNKLQLVQRLKRELFGGDPTTTAEPQSLTGVTGNFQRLVDWTDQAWSDLQGEQQDWRWMLRQNTMPTVAGTREYRISATGQTAMSVSALSSSGTTATATVTSTTTLADGDYVLIAGASPSGYNGAVQIDVTAATTFTYTVAAGLSTPATGTITATLIDYDELRPFFAYADRPYINAVKSGETAATRVFQVPWQTFGGYYDSGNFTDQGRPCYFAIKPDGKLSLHPIPDAVYTLTIPYRKIEQRLVAETTVPELPVKFHPLIVYFAMVHYGASNESNAAGSAGSAFYKKMRRACINQQLMGPDDYESWGPY